MKININDYEIVTKGQMLTFPAYTEFKTDVAKIEIYITSDCKNGIQHKAYMNDKTTSIVEIAISQLSYLKHKINKYIEIITDSQNTFILNLISDKSFLNQGKYFDLILYKKIN